MESGILNFQSSGGHEGTRTPNFLLVREAVYQLTYMPQKFFANCQSAHCASNFSKKRAALNLTANCNATKNQPRLSSAVKFRAISFSFLIAAAAKRNSPTNGFRHKTESSRRSRPQSLFSRRKKLFRACVWYLI